MSAAATRDARARAAERPPRPRRELSRRARLLLGVGSLVAFFGGWELVARAELLPPIFLPAFSAVVREFWVASEEGVLLGNLWISVRIYLVSMVISILLAVPLGLVVGGVRVLNRILTPYVWAIYTLPRVILMPIILLWVGINDTARVVIIVLSAVPATMVVVMEGVVTVDASLLRVARSFGATRWKLLRSVALPATVPFIATGIRMGVSRGLIGLFLGELFTAATGIGFVLTNAARTFNTARMYAMLLLFVLFSVAVVELTRVLERRVSSWRPIPNV